jgi:alkyl sulfatase BDS1-like metallo-beta-lactamase superfamily hydrolase
MGKHSNLGRIADNVYYFSGFDNNVEAGFVATEEGIVVIDTTLLHTSASSLIGMIETLPR